MQPAPTPAHRPRLLRGLVLAVLAAGLMLLAWVVAGPWLAVRGIEQALERRDAGALSDHVDFPRLRVNLKAQLDDRIVRAAGQDIASHPLGALALVMAGGASGAAVDTFATPAGVATLLQGHAVWQRARGRTAGGDTWAATEPARPLQQARLRYESTSRFTATVVDPDGGTTVFVLQRQGLRWRLVDIRLPDDLSAWLH